MNLSLERKWRSQKSTVGDLYIDGVRECFILEDKVREVDGIDVSQWKVQDSTAIPAGRYRIVKDFSTRFKRVTLHLINVPGFVGIRIHPGNTHENTEGCLLPGTARKGADYVMNSLIALQGIEAKVFHALDSEDTVWITVLNPVGANSEEMSWWV